MDTLCPTNILFVSQHTPGFKYRSCRTPASGEGADGPMVGVRAPNRPCATSHLRTLQRRPATAFTPPLHTKVHPQAGNIFTWACRYDLASQPAYPSTSQYLLANSIHATIIRIHTQCSNAPMAISSVVLPRRTP